RAQVSVESGFTLVMASPFFLHPSPRPFCDSRPRKNRRFAGTKRPVKARAAWTVAFLLFPDDACHIPARVTGEGELNGSGALHKALPHRNPLPVVLPCVFIRTGLDPQQGH